MKKKKLLIIIVVIIILILLIAVAGSGGDDNSDTTSSDEDEETSEDQEADSDTGSEDSAMEISFESQTVIENDECSITITDIDEASLLGYLNLSVELENKSSDTNYMFSVESAYINGVDADPYWADTVAAGKSAIGTIAFDMETLEDYGIDSATDIEISFIVYNDDDWSEDYVVDETINIYPYGEENAVKYERSLQESDTVLVDSDEVTVILTGYEVDDIWGYCLNVYLINNTDTEVMYSVDDSSVNGYMADPFWAKSVNAGKSAFSTIYYYESTLEEIGITDLETEIEEIEFTLSAYNNEDWSEEHYVDEVITLNPQGSD